MYVKEFNRLLKKYDIASFASQIGAAPIVDDDGNESEC
jgi:hypothetical protein